MKKLLTIFLMFNLFSFIPSAAFADCDDCDAQEHILSSETIANPDSKALANSVYETENFYIICKGNVIKIAFECKFMSECVKDGECVYFYVPKDIMTSCGSVIIPMGSKLVGKVV